MAGLVEECMVKDVPVVAAFLTVRVVEDEGEEDDVSSWWHVVRGDLQRFKPKRISNLGLWSQRRSK